MFNYLQGSGFLETIGNMSPKPKVDTPVAQKVQKVEVINNNSVKPVLIEPRKTTKRTVNSYKGNPFVRHESNTANHELIPYLVRLIKGQENLSTIIADMVAPKSDTNESLNYNIDRANDEKIKLNEEENKELKNQNVFLQKIEKNTRGGNSDGSGGIGKGLSVAKYAGVIGRGIKGLAKKTMVAGLLYSIGNTIYDSASKYTENLKSQMESQGLTIDDAKFSDKVRVLIDTVGDGLMSTIAPIGNSILSYLNIDYKIDPKAVSKFTEEASKKIDIAIENFRENTGSFGNGVMDFIESSNTALGHITSKIGNHVETVSTFLGDVVNDIGRTFEHQSEIEKRYRKLQEGWGWFDSKEEKESKEKELEKIASQLVNNKDYMENASTLDRKTVISRANKYSAKQKAEENKKYYKDYEETSLKIKDYEKKLSSNDSKIKELKQKISKETNEDKKRGLEHFLEAYSLSSKKIQEELKKVKHEKKSLGDVPYDDISGRSYNENIEDNIKKSYSHEKTKIEKASTKKENLSKEMSILEKRREELLHIANKNTSSTTSNYDKKEDFRQKELSVLEQEIKVKQQQIKEQEEIVRASKSISEELKKSLDSISESNSKNYLSNGVESSYYAQLAEVESGGYANGGYDANRTNSDGTKSKYYGKYQVSEETAKKYIDKLGVTWEDFKNKSEVQEEVIRMLTEDNIKGLKRAGETITNLNLWMAHNLGLSGALDVLKGGEVSSSTLSHIRNQKGMDSNSTRDDYIEYYSKRFDTSKAESYTTSSQHSMATKILNEAKKDIGVKEVDGYRSNPKIIEYLKSTGHNARDDSGSANAWCSAFVNKKVEDAGFKGTNSASAGSWRKWGVESTPQEGAIAVKSRFNKSGRRVGNHVVIVESVNLKNGTMTVIGGNQGDKVSRRTHKISDFDTYRMPDAKKENINYKVASSRTSKRIDKVHKIESAKSVSGANISRVVMSSNNSTVHESKADSQHRKVSNKDESVTTNSKNSIENTALIDAIRENTEATKMVKKSIDEKLKPQDKVTNVVFHNKSTGKDIQV